MDIQRDLGVLCLECLIQAKKLFHHRHGKRRAVEGIEQNIESAFGILSQPFWCSGFQFVQLITEKLVNGLHRFGDVCTISGRILRS